MVNNTKLKNNRYNIAPETHIIINNEKCTGCTHRACLTACPARCYTVTQEKNIVINYEACLECGTCFIICDRGAIEWKYPRGGCGISYRFS